MTLSQGQATVGAHADPDLLDKKAGIVVFLAFAAAYFCSTMARAITATLAPVLTQEFALQSRDLGLMAAGYFFGFAAVQLPLGKLLDRYGPRRVVLCFLSLAVVGCLAFSAATTFTALLASRVLLGTGVGACLMAPLIGYRRWFDTSTQLRANSWMLMTGSLGMLSSTLPVQWLVPLTGWRPLFWLLALMFTLAMVALARVVPAWRAGQHASGGALQPPPRESGLQTSPGSYAEVWKSRYFRKMLPIAFFQYGGMVSMQTLWAGPWMIRVAGYTPLEAAAGLFYLNAAMLAAFWCWGMFNPGFARRGWNATRLIARILPLSLAVLTFNIAGGSSVGWLGWALFCVTSSVVGLAQPAVGMAFRPSLAGRAMAAYNLGIFAGVFVVQWGIGLLIDAFAAEGLSQARSFQWAMGVYLCCCVASYIYFLSVKADNSAQ
jgi:predicted MFS family arabinose efflux permease